MKISFDWLEEHKYSSVTDYCRFLAENGAHPETVVEVYRGEMLCLTVTDVYKAATLEPTGSGWRRVRPRRLSQPRGEV